MICFTVCGMYSVEPNARSWSSEMMKRILGCLAVLSLPNPKLRGAWGGDRLDSVTAANEAAIARDCMSFMVVVEALKRVEVES